MSYDPSRIYFVLRGLVNGEDGIHAVPAGDGTGPVQPDGWYFIRAGSPDGTGPYDSRTAAVRAMEAERRFFVFPLDGGAPDEIPEGHDDAAEDGYVVVVHAPAEHGVRRYEVVSYEPDGDVLELHTNVPTATAHEMLRAALREYDHYE